jgi:uncharacterized membrane protein
MLISMRAKKLFKHLHSKLFVVLDKKWGREEILLCIFVAIYTSIFSYFTIMKMYALKASAWDLGNYNQALYTFVFHGKLFYWTADILNNPTGSLFGIHVSPLFFLLAPIYFIFPRPETLLIIQSFVLAAGAIPSYYLAYNIIGTKKWGIMFALAYLLNPVIIGINWSEFHPEAFIPLAILLVIHYYLQNSWKKLTVSLIFALSIVGEVALILALLALYFMYSTFRQTHQIKQKKSNNLFLLTIIFLLSLIWFLISILIKHSFNPFFPLYFGNTGSWRILGAKNILEIPAILLLNPDRAIEALYYDWENKVYYLLILFGSYGFLSFFSLRALFPAIAWLIPSLLSDNPAYYSIGLQYPAYVVPFVIYSSILGVKNLSKIKNYRLNIPNVKFFGKIFKNIFLIFPLIFLLSSNPFFGLNLAVHEWGRYGFPVIDDSAVSADKLSHLIPRDASILASHNLFPLISSRLNAYTIPWVIDYGTANYFAYIYELVNRVDYIFLDLFNGWDPGRNSLILSLTNGKFGVLGYSDGIILLKRDYAHEPLIFKPLTQVFNYRNLMVQNGFLAYDNSSQTGKVLVGVHIPRSNNTDFWWGPYVILPPGEYKVTYWLKSSKGILPNDSDLLTIDASVFIFRVKMFIVNIKETGAKYIDVHYESTSKKITFPGMTLKGNMLSPNEYKPFSIIARFDVFGSYEFRGMNLTSPIPIFLDRIEIEMIKPLPSVRPVPIRFENYPDLLFETDHVSKILKVAQLIPQNESLMIQDNLYTLINHKGILYTIPFSFKNQSRDELTTQINSLLNKVNYIMLDWKTNELISYLIMSNPILSKNFGIFAWVDGVMLFKRGYAGQPVLFVPYVQTFAYKDLIPRNGTHVISDDAGNYVLLHANITNADFWWGPYVFLPPGVYNVTLWLKSDYKLQSETAFIFEVNLFVFNVTIYMTGSSIYMYKTYTGHKVNLVTYHVMSKEIGVKEFTKISIMFKVEYYGVYEFPGRSVMISDNIYLNMLQIMMIMPHSSFHKFPSDMLDDK